MGIFRHPRRAGDAAHADGRASAARRIVLDGCGLVLKLRPRTPPSGPQSFSLRP